MATKTRRTAKRQYEYKVRGVGVPKGKTIMARNEQDAVNKAASMYPKVRALYVERVSKTGRQYETVSVVKR